MGVIGALLAQNAYAQSIWLSKPGQSSLEWLLTDHEGAKALRSGKACVACHSEGLFDAPRKADVEIKGERGHLRITLDIELKDSKRPSADLALLLGRPEEKSFARIGCWAACHSDMRYMDQDAGLGKYLATTRKRMSRSGGGKELKRLSDLKMLRFQNRFLEMWQIRIIDGEVFTVWQEDLLETSKRLAMGALQASSTVKDGRLTLTIKRPYKIAENLIHFRPGASYILGVALLSDEPPIPMLEVEVGDAAQAAHQGEAKGEDKKDKKDKKSKESGREKDTKDKKGNKDKANSGDLKSEEGEEKKPPLDPKIGPQHWVSFPVQFKL